MELTICLPEKCNCGFENLNIWGTRTKGRTKIGVRCMLCGEILWEVEK